MGTPEPTAQPPDDHPETPSWDARLLAKVQGGEVEQTERREHSLWALIHLPLGITWLATTPTGPFAILILCLWASAIAMNVRAWVHHRRARRPANSRENPFGH